MSKLNTNDQDIGAFLMAASSGEMTNSAAIGYMIMAAKGLGLPHESIRALESMMLEKMDFYSEEQAEGEYRSF